LDLVEGLNLKFESEEILCAIGGLKLLKI